MFALSGVHGCAVRFHQDPEGHGAFGRRISYWHCTVYSAGGVISDQFVMKGE